MQAVAKVRVFELSSGRRRMIPRQHQTHPHLLGAMSDTLFNYNLIVVKTTIIPAVECICQDIELKPPSKNDNHTRQEANALLGVKGCHRNASGEEMAAQVSKRSDTDTEKSQLSKQDIRLMLVMCTELVNLCARLTGKIDPAAGAMLAYVRDDIVAENRNEMQ